MPIHTDRTIAANRPDIVLKNKEDKTHLLIDTTIPLDTNTSVKTTEKLNKDEDLEIEVERMWEQNYTNKLPGNINIHELQKITLLSTAHLLRRVLSIKKKPSLPPKVLGLDSDVERENHSQLHLYILYNINNNNHHHHHNNNNNKLRKPNQRNQNGKRKLNVKYQGSGMTYLR